MVFFVPSLKLSIIVNGECWLKDGAEKKKDTQQRRQMDKTREYLGSDYRGVGKWQNIGLEVGRRVLMLVREWRASKGFYI